MTSLTDDLFSQLSRADVQQIGAQQWAVFDPVAIDDQLQTVAGGGQVVTEHTIQGGQQNDRLTLVIEDDGCGLPPGSGQQGFGLAGMRERVKALGGTLAISCTHGTRVSVSLPLRNHHV